MTILQTWWAWAVLAIILVFLEVISPASLFLGLAIGAGALSVIYMFVSDVWIGGSIHTTMLLFALISLVATIGVRIALKPKSGQVKTFDHDIND